MRRLKRNQNEEFSLFPFIDALSGVIGVLALIIAVMAIMGLDSTRLLQSQWESFNGLNPVFVECAADKLLVHPNGEAIAVVSGGFKSNRWSQLSRQLADAKNSYVVFVVRPDGIETYWSAKGRLPNSLLHGIDVVSHDRELRFGT